LKLFQSAGLIKTNATQNCRVGFFHCHESP